MTINKCIQSTLSAKSMRAFLVGPCVSGPLGVDAWFQLRRFDRRACSTAPASTCTKALSDVGARKLPLAGAPRPSAAHRGPSLADGLQLQRAPSDDYNWVHTAAQVMRERERDRREAPSAGAVVRRGGSREGRRGPGGGMSVRAARAIRVRYGVVNEEHTAYSGSGSTLLFRDRL